MRLKILVYNIRKKSNTGHAHNKLEVINLKVISGLIKHL